MKKEAKLIKELRKIPPEQYETALHEKDLEINAVSLHLSRLNLIKEKVIRIDRDIAMQSSELAYLKEVRTAVLNEVKILSKKAIKKPLAKS